MWYEMLTYLPYQNHRQFSISHFQCQPLLSRCNLNLLDSFVLLHILVSLLSRAKSHWLLVDLSMGHLKWHKLITLQNELLSLILRMNHLRILQWINTQYIPMHFPSAKHNRPLSQLPWMVPSPAFPSTVHPPAMKIKMKDYQNYATYHIYTKNYHIIWMHNSSIISQGFTTTRQWETRHT